MNAAGKARPFFGRAFLDPGACLRRLMDVTGQKEEVRMEELIARARAGDGAAFAQLMEGQKQMLYKVARSYLRSDADAADAMGETVLSCYEKLDTLRQPRYFRTWLTRILIRKCQDILRRQGAVSPWKRCRSRQGRSLAMPGRNFSPCWTAWMKNTARFCCSTTARAFRRRRLRGFWI